ncbi:PREDICTED: delta-1-pyrroline-5-carboxylate synthase A-like [Brassica oleracea var. oleracea]|uniref:Delta-1-pyrroline-5-carboxylate synthase n=1 Tax=Brassica oleracea var. oleracea TaxID=109376 RepID=A0A0D3B5X2_BRAOL|nr:PREDICTED: delta-1-pyrroline-5-carboxylate synthase A-like [Brassica oleracea var. oleracea]
MEETDRSRAFAKDVKRIVVKVGTAVVTGKGGRLALGRLGALCEQLAELNSDGFEVILVTSGAVGLGRQRLRYRQMINSSFADLQKPQSELDGKACAGVGQSSLMAYYETMFDQLDVTAAQLLVNDSSFRDKDFRKQLSETVKSMLDLSVIPIFNENDAISTRRAPYQDSSGIFWDNDSLAALLALELKADLLILLSDVEGLYTGPPSDPDSKLIHTFIKEKHQDEITFGDKSRLGRGGMTAKVKAAVNAAYAGIPVIITSGFSTENIDKVLRGLRVGTLFHQDACQWAPVTDSTARDMAVAARESSRKLQALSSEDRKQILYNVADALEANVETIRAENELDVAAAQEAGLEESMVARLVMTPAKISSLAASVRKLADMEDPIGRVLKKTEVADGLVLEKTSSPLGVLLIVFESRPDALVQIASLAIRSGNGLLLKGGKEARRSNAILHKVITDAIPETVGGKLIGLVTSREEIPDLLKLDDVIDLVIPRGSNKLVSQIKSTTKIPVLGHADGICHVYVDKACNVDMAKRIVSDSKLDYPAACNAMETLLVHKDHEQNGVLNDLIFVLQNNGVTLYGGPKASKILNIPQTPTFNHEYCSKACTVEVVEDVYAAIDHIHRHGSAHTDCIVTEDPEVAELFLRQVDSAAVFHNASTRFSDGFRFGLGAEVGISTGRIHARGPVGVEGLLTTRWILRGNGQVVDGDNGIAYTHQDIPI